MLAKVGFETAETEPLRVHLLIQPWDLIFTEPPRPATAVRATPETRERMTVDWAVKKESRRSRSNENPQKYV